MALMKAKCRIRFKKLNCSLTEQKLCTNAQKLYILFQKVYACKHIAISDSLMISLYAVSALSCDSSLQKQLRVKVPLNFKLKFLLWKNHSNTWGRFPVNHKCKNIDLTNLKMIIVIICDNFISSRNMKLCM